jgi:hypothetical protein
MDMFLWDEHLNLGLDAIVGWIPPDTGTRVSPTLTAGPPIRLSPPALLMSDRHPLAHRSSLDIEELADVEVLFSHGLGRLIVPWVPAVTPRRRPIRRVRRDIRYLDRLLPELASSTLVHLTIAEFGQTLPLTGLSLVPLIGRKPFVCRTVWPTIRETPAVREFARIAAKTGSAAGWLVS